MSGLFPLKVYPSAYTFVFSTIFSKENFCNLMLLSMTMRGPQEEAFI